ncbi:MAG: sulfite exporter TauE/SafE family protein [Pseudolabrys sp.]
MVEARAIQQGSAQSKGRLWPLLAGTCIGTVIGVALLPRDDNGRATVWLGLALAIYAVLGLVKVQFSVPRHAETWLGLLMGTATGAITVATGIFVMPGTPYLQSMQFDRDRLVQALGLSFTVSTITLAAALAYTGHVQKSLAWPSIVALAAALVGMGLGQLTRGRIKAETFRLCFFVGLMLLGIHLALRGLL